MEAEFKALCEVPRGFGAGIHFGTPFSVWGTASTNNRFDTTPIHP